MLPQKDLILQQKKYHSMTENTQSSYHNCDVQKVMKGLYIGDELVASNKKLLLDLNIRHIVVVGLQLKAHYPQSFNYLSIPVRDHKKQNIAEHFQKTNSFIEKVLQSNQTVFVHCAKGISRSATIVLAFLMYKFRMKSYEALVFVRRKRSQISPNQGFLHQLKKYEEQLATK